MNILFESGNYYHVYNRAIGDERLFLDKENYEYFLFKWQEFINPIANVYAYCLMSNHFHFLLKVKWFPTQAGANLQGSQNLGGLNVRAKEDYQKAFSKHISQQFSNFFNAYTKAINKKYERKGGLFIQNFKRRTIESQTDFANVMVYIHTNPVHHGYCKKPEKWKHSSFNEYRLMKSDFVRLSDGIQELGGVYNFIHLHEKKVELLEELRFED